MRMILADICLTLVVLATDSPFCHKLLTDYHFGTEECDQHGFDMWLMETKLFSVLWPDDSHSPFSLFISGSYWKHHDLSSNDSVQKSGFTIRCAHKIFVGTQTSKYLLITQIVGHRTSHKFFSYLYVIITHYQFLIDTQSTGHHFDCQQAVSC